LIGATGDPSPEHLAGGDERSVVDELRRQETPLARPDVLLQPGPQRHVVGDAAHKGHRCVRVCVHEPRQQHVGGQRDLLAGAELAVDFAGGHHRLHAPAIDHQRVVSEGARGLDGQDPARIQSKVDRDRHA
jgi:hypothetical protein